MYTKTQQDIIKMTGYMADTQKSILFIYTIFEKLETKNFKYNTI